MPIMRPEDYRLAFKQWLEESSAGTLQYFDGCMCTMANGTCSGHVNYWLSATAVTLWPPSTSA